MPDFRTAWDRLGNESTVIVAAGGRWVAHTHTDDPDAVRDEIKQRYERRLKEIFE